MTIKHHIITDQKRGELAAIAARMPQLRKRNLFGMIMQEAPKKIRGEQIIAAGQTKMYGQEIIPSKFYRLANPQYVNHFQMLLDAYKDGGDAFVAKYEKRARKLVWRELSFRTKWKMFWNTLSLKFNLK